MDLVKRIKERNANVIRCWSFSIISMVLLPNGDSAAATSQNEYFIIEQLWNKIIIWPSFLSYANSSLWYSKALHINTPLCSSTVSRGPIKRIQNTVWHTWSKLAAHNKTNPPNILIYNKHFEGQDMERDVGILYKEDTSWVFSLVFTILFDFRFYSQKDPVPTTSPPTPCPLRSWTPPSERTSGCWRCWNGRERTLRPPSHRRRRPSFTACWRTTPRRRKPALLSRWPFCSMMTRRSLGTWDA